ncbi:hypothetical protein A3K73_08065 [Candidatus Pacearchaeota archaeon RBG_13_36_9]|nr:MAG: hypothetical protein A3K73_08065 [Candidatus Pacearchaeota archaeon RBG_13_36_9]
MKMRYDYESFTVRIEEFQKQKRRAKDTFRKNASNIKILVPAEAYNDFLTALDIPGFSEDAYRGAYLNGLAELLGTTLNKALESDYSPATKQNIRATARLILKAYYLKHFLEQDPFNRKIGEIIRQAFFVTEDELKKLMGAAPLPSKDHPYEGLRDKASYWILYNTGATISELVRLNCRDFNQDEGLVKLTNKDNRIRKIFFDWEKCSCVTDYIKAFNKNYGYPPLNEGVLLRNKWGNQVSTRSIRRNLKRDAEKAGLERKDSIEPMWFRYAFANAHKREGSKRLAELLGIEKGSSKKLIELLG